MRNGFVRLRVKSGKPVVIRVRSYGFELGGLHKIRKTPAVVRTTSPGEDGQRRSTPALQRMVRASRPCDAAGMPGAGAGRRRGSRKVRGILFDVDDTLVDQSTSARKALVAHVTEDDLLGAFSNADEAVTIWREITEYHYARYLMGEVTLRAQRHARVRDFLTQAGVTGAQDMSDEDASAWYSAYASHKHSRYIAFADASPSIARLAAHYRLGIVSNSSIDHQREKLRAVGLLSFFGDAVVCARQHGAAKPASSIFYAGCALLGLRVGEVAHVGDSYLTDAVGARLAGLGAVWLNRRGRNLRDPAEGIRVIRSLYDLPAVLTD
ncbi:HAD-IA family hydrolase [Streptomyces sp. SID5998]|nr:HAD-IA family hydrolase [Streptomyces sp. SID5998]